MRPLAWTPTALSPLVLLVSSASAQAPAAARKPPPDPSRAPGLEREIEAERTLNRELLRRLEELEAAQAELRRRLDAGTAAGRRDEESGRIAELAGDLLPKLEPGVEGEGPEAQWEAPPTLAGYYDFQYLNDNRRASPGTFRNHELSLHLMKEMDRFRLFSELEFEYGPLFGGSGGTDLEQARGEIDLEQAWGEYTASNLLTLRAGLVLTPGYWNVNHYPSIVLSTRRPLMVRQVFPVALTGVLGYGTRYWGEWGVTYQAYVGNGRSEFSTKQDDNEGKAGGGRVTLHVPAGERFFTFDVGASGYVDHPSGEERNATWGLDTQIRSGPVELLAEFAARDAEQDRTGLYVQPSYRLDARWALFYRFDLLDTDDIGDTREHTVGLDFRPIHPVSLKFELFRSLREGEQSFWGMAASVAIAF